MATRLKEHPDLGYTCRDTPENYIEGKRVFKGEICM